jgi:hypothetical protein
MVHAFSVGPHGSIRETEVIGGKPGEWRPRSGKSRRRNLQGIATGKSRIGTQHFKLRLDGTYENIPMIHLAALCVSNVPKEIWPALQSPRALSDRVDSLGQ